MAPVVAVEVHAGRKRKSEMTRQRLLDSANRLFRANGYAATTAAAIAEDAGVTERTFYRYFAAKADVLLTNWQRRRDVLHRVLVTSDAPDVIDVVRAAMHEFAEHVRIGIDAGLDSMLHVFTDQDAAVRGASGTSRSRAGPRNRDRPPHGPLLRAPRGADRSVRDRWRLPSLTPRRRRARRSRVPHCLRRSRDGLAAASLRDPRSDVLFG